MRMTTSRSRNWVAAIAVGACMAPAVLHAQDAATDAGDRTHVVREGDTLWDIARQYLGDPFLWPEIYRLNTAVVEDPHWIYPGETLRLPGSGGGVVAVSDPGAGQQGGTGGGTIFAQRRIRGGVAAQRLGMIGRDAMPVVRRGEFYAAPFVVHEDGPGATGEILRGAEESGIARAGRQDRFQLEDRVFVEAPTGRVATTGDRYLAFRRGPVIPGVGRVLMPTGIVSVDRPMSGEATIAHIAEAFDAVLISQPLIPLDSFPLTTTARPGPVERGITASVIHIPNDPVLPSLLHYIVLDATSANGVTIGDQFTLYTDRDEAEGKALTPRIVATLRVVRVTDRATTTMVIDQEQPKIREGMVARLTAKMP
jgi:hypothetical protein